MFHDSGFPIVAVPLMVLMMVGMGLMMWFMMKMMMGMGHDGPHEPRHNPDAGKPAADEMNSLREEIASLRQELQSTRTGSASAGGTGGVSSEAPELKGRDRVG
jgi:hypothetical protein